MIEVKKVLVSILKSKIHKATVTDAKIDYIGSITIDRALMDAAKILPFEKVLVASIDSGQRLETYVIEGKKNSGEICLNGAAARKIIKGDKVIIMSFAAVNKEEAKKLKPLIVHVDENNRIVVVEDHTDKNDQC